MSPNSVLELAMVEAGVFDGPYLVFRLFPFHHYGGRGRHALPGVRVLVDGREERNGLDGVYVEIGGEFQVVGVRTHCSTDGVGS